MRFARSRGAMEGKVTRPHKKGSTAVWPMPVPYPELWVRGAGAPSDGTDRATATYLNVVVIALDWLEWGCPGVVPDGAPLGPIDYRPAVSCGQDTRTLCCMEINRIRDPARFGTDSMQDGKRNVIDCRA